MPRNLFYFFLAGWLFSAGSCKTTVTVAQLSIHQKQHWDSLYYNWISNGMGTCTPMMETELKDGNCTRHRLQVRMYIGSDGIIKKITVLKNEIVCDNPTVIASLEKCMLSTLKTDFIFLPEKKGIVLEASVGGPAEIIPNE